MSTISPNMNLPVPTPSVTPGPDWADDVVADMNAIDSHDHTPGKGVPITPDGLDLNADVPLNGNDLTEVRSVNFQAQGSPLAGVADLGCIYVSGADLYYNDEAGNQVRITQGGSVSGSAGTITGLPSGTASASYAAGTFTFQSATSTPANMAVGPVAIGRNAASSKTVTLAPNAAQASNFAITFPAALPASTSVVAIGSTGSLSNLATTGTGDVVLNSGATLASPTLTGASVGLADGTVGVPTLSFTSDTDTGFYRGGANIFNAAAGGTDVCSFSVGGIGVTGSVGASTGLSTAGGGVFLVKVFGPTSLGATTAATLTAPGTVIGVMGWTTRAANVNFSPMVTFQSGTVPTGVYFDGNTAASITSAQIRIANGEASARTYTVVVFYQ